MPHIELPQGLVGMRSLLAYRPETARPLSDFAQALLVGPSPLSRADRELIGAFVSARNECHFCCSAHSAIAAVLLGDEALVTQVATDPEQADVTPKLKRLLAIAARVQEGGRRVDAEVVAAARAEGATDLEIHDTVLIAAAFCMFNRYVDGLATETPDDPAVYRARAVITAAEGYKP